MPREYNEIPEGMEQKKTIHSFVEALRNKYPNFQFSVKEGMKNHNDTINVSDDKNGMALAKCQISDTKEGPCWTGWVYGEEQGYSEEEVSVFEKSGLLNEAPENARGTAVYY